MKRVFRIFDIGAELIYSPRGFLVAKTSVNRTTIPTTNRWFSTEVSRSSSPRPISALHAQFADKMAYADVQAKEDLIKKVSLFKNELMANVEDEDTFDNLLEAEGWNLLKIHPDGAAFVHLLRLFESSPHLAIKVFNWRRKIDHMTPMSSEEYAKGIKLAGRIKDVDLALEIFIEAADNRIKNNSTYNALMGAYLWNNLSEKCLSVYQDLKQDINCCPTLVTFNILISLYGRRVLIDQMEAVFQEMKDYEVAPNLYTYNSLIAGYVTAWMWDSMEDTYRMMETGPIHPNLDTRLLMIRGYAHSGSFEKMEEIYNIVGPHVREKHIPLIRTMICGYCNFPYKNRVKRIEELLRLIPENEYRPWLNVLLIRVYAEEDLVDQMDESIEEAFEHNTSVNTVKLMLAISSTYIRHSAVDKLAMFIMRSQVSGWRVCRSLYHHLMRVYASHRRIEEMEQVLDEMERLDYGYSKKTLSILYMAYSKQDERYRPKLYRVLGLMCKYGYGRSIVAECVKL